MIWCSANWLFLYGYCYVFVDQFSFVHKSKHMLGLKSEVEQTISMEMQLPRHKQHSSHSFITFSRIKSWSDRLSVCLCPKCYISFWEVWFTGVIVLIRLARECHWGHNTVCNTNPRIRCELSCRFDVICGGMHGGVRLCVRLFELKWGNVVV